jgi:hypothetical protein
MRSVESWILNTAALMQLVSVEERRAFSPMNQSCNNLHYRESLRLEIHSELRKTTQVKSSEWTFYSATYHLVSRRVYRQRARGSVSWHLLEACRKDGFSGAVWHQYTIVGSGRNSTR